MGEGEEENGSRICLLRLNSITRGESDYRRVGLCLEAELPVILVLPLLNHWMNKDFSLSSEVKQILKLISERIGNEFMKIISSH